MDSSKFVSSSDSFWVVEESSWCGDSYPSSQVVGGLELLGSKEALREANTVGGWVAGGEGGLGLFMGKVGGSKVVRGRRFLGRKDVTFVLKGGGIDRLEVVVAVVEGVVANGICGGSAWVGRVVSLGSSGGVSPSICAPAGETGVEGGSELIYVVMIGEGAGEAMEPKVGVVAMLFELGTGRVTPRAVA